MIELQYIPDNIPLKGLVFTQTEYVDGIQSEGAVEGAAHIKGADHNGEEISLCMQLEASVIAKHEKDPSTYIPVLGEGSDAPKIALYEQVIDVEGQSGMKSAKWRSILQEKRKDPAPFWGVGRQEYDAIERFDTEKCRELLLELEDVKAEAQLSESPMEFESKIMALEEAILAERPKARVRAVFYMLHEMITLNAKEISRPTVTEIVYDFLEKFTYGGMIGGVIIRARKNGVVYGNLSAELRRTEDYRVKDPAKRKQNFPPMPVDYILNQFLEYQGGKYMLNEIWKDPEMEVDFIPLIAINCGNKSNQKYKKPQAFRKMRSTYCDHKDPLKGVCRVMAARISEFEDPEDDPRGEGIYMLTSAHSFSDALGNVLELNGKYERQYVINYDNVRFERLNGNDSKRWLAMGSHISKEFQDELMKKAG